MEGTLARSSQGNTRSQTMWHSPTSLCLPKANQELPLSATQIQTWSEAPLSSHLGRTPGPCVGLRSLFLFLQGPTAAFTHHWGSEKGGTSRQVCKEGGKLVFSQGSSHRKGAQASCRNQNGFRNHSDVWFVRKRVERGVLFVSGNCDFLLARRGHGRKAEGQACKHQWPPCLRLELFDLKTKNIYYQLVGLRHPGIHLFITGYHENGKKQWKQFASCLRQLCLNRLYPFGTFSWRTSWVPQNQGRHPFLHLEIFCKSRFVDWYSSLMTCSTVCKKCLHVS